MGQSKTALIVVDVQPTFCEGGALGVVGGNDVAQRIAEFVRQRRSDYGLVVSTQDWHIEPGDHFSDQPDFVDTWPPHGIAGTAEAELHPALSDLDADVAIRKGQYAAAYSGFDGADAEGRRLDEILAEAGIAHLDIVGIAESHCVLQTALDAINLPEPPTVRVFTDLTVPVSEDQGERARGLMREAGVLLEDSGL